MKQLLLILTLLLTTVSFAQTDTTSVNTTTIDAEQLVKQANDITDVVKPYVVKLLNATEVGAEFLIDEIPLVIQQFIVYNAIEYTLFVLLGLFLLIYSKRIAYYAFAKHYVAKLDEEGNKIPPSRRTLKSWQAWEEVKENIWLKIDTDGDHTDSMIGVEIIKWVSIATGAMFVLCNIFVAIKCIFFPKLFLVETFIKMI